MLRICWGLIYFIVQTLPCFTLLTCSFLLQIYYTIALFYTSSFFTKFKCGYLLFEGCQQLSIHQKRKCFLICNATCKIRGEKRLLVLDSISILLSRQWVVERLSPKTAARPYSEPFSASYWSGLRFSKEGWLRLFLLLLLLP